MRRALLLSVASGILYAAAQPPFGLAPLAFVALVPLLAAASTPGVARRLLLGGVAGTVAGIGCVGSSVYSAARLYFEQPPAIAVLVAVAVPLVYGAPFFALFSALAGPASRDERSVLRPLLVAPAAWVVGELARAEVGHGTPWCLLAHPLVGSPEMLQTASIGGAFAVSFLVAAANVGVLGVLRALRGRLAPGVAAGRVLAAASLVVLALVYGRAEIARWRHSEARTLRVALVQPNVPHAWRGRLARVPAILDRLVDLTREAAAGAPDLVVWPENAVGFVAAANDLPLRRAGEVLPRGAALVLGAPRSVLEGGERSGAEASFRNSALLVDDRGTILATADKRRLTPFAEDWPAGLPAPASPRDLYLPGDEVVLFDVGGVPVGILVCYEAIYPDLARDLVREGAEVLVNISNDAWFGASPALAQHFAAARVRAVELRRPLVRATNTGWSAIVAPTGEILADLAPEAPGVATAEITPSSQRTLYARFGDAFAWLCVVGVAIDLLRARFAAGRSPRLLGDLPQVGDSAGAE